MHNRQIPRAEWFNFFRAFSEWHQEWPVTVQVLRTDLGSQVEARDLPLEGMVANPEGTGPISIHVGCTPENHVEHEVENPRQVWVELSEGGGEGALEIESTDGTKTIVHFRKPAPPEILTGVSPS